MSTVVNGWIARVSLIFVRFNDAKLIVWGRNVLALMATQVAQYPLPSPTLAEVGAAIDLFEQTVKDAFKGGSIATGAKNAQRVTVLNLLRRLAAYVQGHCGMVAQNIIATGFEAVRAGSPIGDLPPPSAAALTAGSVTGSIMAVTGRVNGSSICNWRVFLVSAPNVDVQTAQSVASRMQFFDLTAGQIYGVESNVTGSAGTSDWSETSTLMAV